MLAREKVDLKDCQVNADQRDRLDHVGRSDQLANVVNQARLEKQANRALPASVETEVGSTALVLYFDDLSRILDVV